MRLWHAPARNKTAFQLLESTRRDRSWILIDVLGGVGLVSAIWYYFSRVGTEARAAALDALWIGFTTNVVTAWLGVRFIDALLRHRETRVAMRAEVAGAVESFRFLADAVLAGDKGAFDEFDELLKFLDSSREDSLPSSLSERDREVVERVRAKASRLRWLARDLVKLHEVAQRQLSSCRGSVCADIRRELENAFFVKWLNLPNVMTGLERLASREPASDEVRELVATLKMLIQVALDCTRAHRDVTNEQANARWLLTH